MKHTVLPSLVLFGSAALLAQSCAKESADAPAAEPVVAEAVAAVQDAAAQAAEAAAPVVEAVKEAAAEAPAAAEAAVEEVKEAVAPVVEAVKEAAAEAPAAAEAAVEEVKEAVAPVVEAAGEAAAEASAAAEAAVEEAKEAAAPTVAPAVAVRIDGADAITVDELDEMAEGIFRQYARQIPPEMAERARADIRRRAMQNLIDQRILCAEAVKQGLSLDPAEKLEALAEMTGMTNLETVALVQGIPPEKFDRMFSESLLASKLVSLQTNDVAEPTDEAAKARFDEIVKDHPEAAHMPDQVTAAHILVMAQKDSVTPEEDAAALAKINSIRERALAGEDFGALAKEFSEDPGSKDNGGEYTFGRGRMVPEFEKAAFEQEIGVVGEPVRTSYGYHILKVSKRSLEHDVTFEEVADTIKDGLRREAVAEKIQSYVKSLRDAAQVEVVEKAVVSEPIAVPLQPAAEPEVPAAEPEAPAAEPEAPAAEPEAPAEPAPAAEPPAAEPAPEAPAAE